MSVREAEGGRLGCMCGDVRLSLGVGFSVVEGERFGGEFQSEFTSKGFF